MNPHHMVTPVQQQDTYSYTTRTELSSTGNNELLMMNGLYVDQYLNVLKIHKVLRNHLSEVMGRYTGYIIIIVILIVSHPTTPATTSVGTTQSSGNI